MQLNLNRTLRPLVLAASVTVLALCLPPASYASPLFETVGAVNGHGGFNARFTDAGSASAYFNPALLPRAQNSIDVGYFVFNDAIDITLGARQGVNVPDFPTGVGFPSGAGFTPFTLPTEELYLGCDRPDQLPCRLPARPRQQDGSSGQTRHYATLGLVTQIVDEYLTAGFYAMIPLGNYTEASAFFPDEREQFFTNSLHPELYSDRLRAPSLGFGLGSQVHEQLSLGLAFTISLLNTATAGVYVPDAANQSETLILSTDVGVVAKVAPHFSVAWTPEVEGLTITATAHSPSRFEIETGFGNLLSNGEEQVAVRTTTHDYMPWIVGLGGEYDFHSGRMDYTLTGGVTWTNWANYINRHGERPLDGYEWSNIVVPSVGFRARQADWTVSFDTLFQQSPVPEQTGRTNYVDNSRLSSSVGFDYRFTLGNLRLAFGAHLQGHILFERSHDKIEPNTTSAIRDPASQNFGQNFDPNLVIDELPDQLLFRGEPYAPAAGLQTNNPGYPGYSSQGFMFGAGINLRIFY